MHNRRDFLKLGAGFAGALGVPGIALAGELPTDLPGEVDLVLYDSRKAAGRRLASRARRAGIAGIPLRGDIAGVWSRVIEPELKLGSLRLMGLTASFQAYAISELAADYGHRVTAFSTGPRVPGSMTDTASYLEIAVELAGMDADIQWMLAPAGINFRAG